MLNQDQLQRRLSIAFDAQQAALLAEVVTEAYTDLVKTSDFNELKEIVRDLAQAQGRTEQRMEELAQAQSRTEQRVEELAQAQNRTEQRVDTLALRMEELAQAQSRTEIAIRELTEGLIGVRRQVGGLATTVGYRLEDEAYKALPALLARDHHIEIRGRLKRGYVTDAQGRVLEVNILGDGVQNEQPIKIIGESKSQLSIPNIDRFVRRHVTPLQQVFPRVFPVLITYMVSSPEVDAYAEEQGIALYYSYDF